MPVEPDKLDRTISAVREQLLAARVAADHWEGELSGSALSTATAVFALASADRAAHRALIAGGLDWLVRNRNDDGGWGDTVASRSNLSTTALVWAALTAGDDRGAAASAQAWLTRRVGGIDPPRLAEAIAAAYGPDRSFSVPILTMCALAGRLGPAPHCWRLVAQLPFELAALPRGWLRRVGLPVVSYALPALIAVGTVRCHLGPARNPIGRLVRKLARRRALDVLARIQPDGGGFLEAAPLTSFVAMSLVGAGLGDHVVARRALEFLAASVRDDGSWAIDTNLATWVTSLSVNALAAASGPDGHAGELDAVRQWLLDRQFRCKHPYTGAPAGGWAWTHLPGGVPDADDTAAALLALHKLRRTDPRTPRAANAGIKWLLNLQNRDGGIPTFCRGWGRLPFDRSAPDLTAHALRAWSAWRKDSPAGLQGRILPAAARAIEYLGRTWSPDGAWTPLWFGNEAAPAQQNLTYGTAKVLTGLAELPGPARGPVEHMIHGASRWLLGAQNPDGGWGGAPQVPSSIEETAVAVEALAAAGLKGDRAGSTRPVERGVNWLIETTGGGTNLPAAPIGLYFARLWYHEKLYPPIFALSALARARAALSDGGGR